jgi:6-phosphogluconolactonase
MSITIEICADAASLAGRGAELVSAAAQSAAVARGVFAVALSGGSTPRGLYEMLARRGTGARVPWRRVHVYWGDERCVPPDHPDSNYGMARTALLSRVEIPEENVHRMRGEDGPQDAARAYEDELRRPPLGAGAPAAGAGGETPGAGAAARRRPAVAARGAARPAATVPGAAARGASSDGRGALPVLDVVLLGLGTDGHTASLFPHAEAVTETERLCVPSTAPDGSQRLTLTFPVINNARRVIFLVSGAGKAGMIAEVLEGLRIPDAIPAQKVEPQLGDIVWLLDEAAAGGLGEQVRAAAHRV